MCWKGDIMGLLNSWFMVIDRDGIDTEAGYLALKEVSQPHDPSFLRKMAHVIRHLVGQASPAFHSLPKHFNNVTAVMSIFIAGSLIRLRPYWLPNQWGIGRQAGEQLNEPHAVFQVRLKQSEILSHIKSSQLTTIFRKFKGADGNLEEDNIPRAINLHVRNLIKEIYRRGWQIVVQNKGTEYHGINAQEELVSFYIAPAPPELRGEVVPVSIEDMQATLPEQYGLKLERLPPHFEPAFGNFMFVAGLDKAPAWIQIAVVIVAAAYIAWKYLHRKKPALPFYDLASLHNHSPVDNVLMPAPIKNGIAGKIKYGIMNHALQALLSRGEPTREAFEATAKLIGHNNALGSPTLDLIQTDTMAHLQSVVLGKMVKNTGLSTSLTPVKFFSWIVQTTDEDKKKAATAKIDQPAPQGKDVFAQYSFEDFKIAATAGGLEQGLNDLSQSLHAVRAGRLGGVVLTFQPEDKNKFETWLGERMPNDREVLGLIIPDPSGVADPAQVQPALVHDLELPANWILARPLEAGLRNEMYDTWNFENLPQMNPARVIIDMITLSGLVRIEVEGVLSVVREALEAA